MELSDDSASSAGRANVAAGVNAQALDEKQYGEVDVVLQYIEDARRRAERAAAELRAGGAEDCLIEALEQAQEDLSQAAKKLIQGSFFAVPSAQLSF